MIDRQTIIALAEQYLHEAGSESYLVDVTVSRDNTVVVEIDNDDAVDVDECAALSRHVESHLDRDREDFELTVSSSGLTSPLKTLRQYAKWEGETMEVMLRDGRKLRGTLGAADDEGFDFSWTTQERPIDPATGKPVKRKQDVEHRERLLHSAVNRVSYNF